MDNPTNNVYTGNAEKRTPESIASVAESKKQALQQAADLKKLSLTAAETPVQPTEPQTTPIDTGSIEKFVQGSKSKDLAKGISYVDYVLKYGDTSDSRAEFANYQFNSIVKPEGQERVLQNRANNLSAGDLAVDSALGAAAGASNMVLGTVGLAANVLADPLEAGVQTVDTLGTLGAKFIGKEDEYKQFKQELSNDYDEIASNVDNFLAERGFKDKNVISFEEEESSNIIKDSLNKIASVAYKAASDSSKYFKDKQSDATKARAEIRARDNKEYVAQLEKELGEDAGWLDHVNKNVKTIGTSFYNLVSDPASLAIVSAESLPTLVGAGAGANAINKASIRNAQKDAIANVKAKVREIEDNVKSRELPGVVEKEIIRLDLKENAAKLEAIRKDVAPGIGLRESAAISAGVLEGGGAAGETYDMVISTKPEILAKVSDRYNELMEHENNYTPEEAREVLALESAVGAGSVVFGLGYATAKLMSADSINRLTGNTKTASTKQVVGDMATQSFEEAIIGFGSGLVTGSIKQDNIDPNADIVSDAAIQAGEGAAAGLSTAGVLGSLNVATANTRKKVKESGTARRKAKEIVVSGLKEKDLNVLDKDFNFTSTIRGIHDRNLKDDITTEELRNNVVSARGLISDYFEYADQLDDIIENRKDSITEEEYKRAVNKLSEVQKEIRKNDALIKGLTQKRIDPKQIQKDIEEASKGDTDAAERVMNNIVFNPESVSQEELQALTDSGTLNEEQQGMVNLHAQYLEDAKTLSEVNSDVMTGGEGFLGISEHLETIGSALEAGNAQVAGKAFARLMKFAKRHNEKANDFEEAFNIDRNRSNATPEQIARFNEINEKYPNSTQVGRDTVHRGSSKLVNTVRQEADALNNAVALAENNIRKLAPKPKTTSASTNTNTTPKNSSESDTGTPDVEGTIGSVERVKRYTVDSVREGNKENKVFIFGDNLIGKGKAGQAIIRDEPNTIGIPTKRLPSNTSDAFFGVNIEEEKAAITEAVNKIIAAKNEGKTIVMPEDGIGTGLADLSSKSPEVFTHLNNELKRAGLIEDSVNKTTEPEESDNNTQSSNKSTDDSDLPPWDIESDQKEVNTPDIEDTPPWDIEEDAPKVTEPVKINNDTTSLVKALDTLMESTYDENSEEAYAADITKVINELNSLTITDTKLSNEREDILNDIHGYIDEDKAEHIRDFIKDLNQQVESSNSMEDSDLPPWDTTEVTPPESSKETNATGSMDALIKSVQSLQANVQDPVSKELFIEKVRTDILPNQKAVRDLIGQKELAKIMKMFREVNDTTPKPKATTPTKTKPKSTSKKTNSKSSLDTITTVETEAEVDTVNNDYDFNTTKEGRYVLFLEEDLVKKYFARVKKEGITENPLFTKNNFLAELRSNPEGNILEFTQIERVTDAHKNLASKLEEHHIDFVEGLNEIYSPALKRNQDMVQYFLNEDGEFDPRLLEAMSVATYNWLATGAGSTLFNTHDEIRRIIKADKDAILSPDTVKHLNSGTLRNSTANEIGASVLRSMGVKVLGKAPKNMKPQLENSIGLLAIAALHKQGMITTKDVPASLFFDDTTKDRMEELADKFQGVDLKRVRNSNPKTKAAKKYKEEAIEYFKYISDKVPMITAYTEFNEESNKAELHPVLQDIVDSVKGTDSMLNNMFKVESHLNTYSIASPSYVNPKVRNSTQEVSQQDQEIIKHHQTLKHYLKDDQVEVFNALSTDALRDILGYTTDLGTVQTNRIDSVNSVNRGIDSSIDLMREAITDIGSGTPFYFRHQMMKNNRLLLLSNTLNPQNDKLHRHLIKIQNQDATVDLTKQDSPELDAFYIALAQSLGVKVDKQLQDISIAEVKAKLEEPVFKEAISALNNRNGDRLSAIQENAIVAAVKAGKEKAWSLDGLVAYANFVEAKANGDKTFKHDLMIEADGITNGPGIATIQFGVGFNQADMLVRLKKIGINHKDDTQEFGEFISKNGNLDNYETVTKELKVEFESLSGSDKAFADFGLFLFGELVSFDPDTGEEKINRNISKNPLMTTIYGAGKKSMMRAFGEHAVEEIYSYLEENAGDVDKLNALKNQIEITFKVKLDDSFVDSPLSYTLPYGLKARIKNKVGGVFGESMTTAIDSIYGQFKEATTVLNESMGIIAETFQKVFSHAVEKRTQELVEQGVLAVSSRGTVLEMIPIEEENRIFEELLNAQPILHSVVSATTGNVKEGLFVGKTKNVTSRDVLALTTNQEYKNYSQGNARMSAELLEYISGGVSPVVTAVQNIDATTMLRHLRDKRSFNVYDAIITSVRYAGENTKDMNKHFYQINSEHSIAGEFQNAFERAEQAVKEYDAANGTSFAKEFGVNKTKYVSGNKQVYNVRNTLIDTVAYIDANKTEMHSLIGRVGQYGWENASYEVTKAELSRYNVTIKGIVNSDDSQAAPNLFNSPFGEDTQYGTDRERHVNAMNATEVFDELSDMGNTPETEEHSAYLRDTVDTLKSKLTEPLKLHLTNVLSDTMANVQGSDIYLYTQMFGGQPGSTAILNAGLRMSAQEAFAHELWHAVSRHGIEGNSIAKRELERRWEQARRSVKVTDLMDDPTLPETSLEYQEAQKAWDYIFTPRIDETRVVVDPITGKSIKKVYSNHLHEFAAWSMTNAKFISALKKVNDNSKGVERVRLDDGSFLNNLYNKLLNFLGKILDRLSVQLTNTNNTPTDVAVRELVKQLANIESTNKNKVLKATDSLDKAADATSGIISSVAKSIAKPLNKLANSDAVRNSQSEAVRIAGVTTRVLSKNEFIADAFDALKNVRRNMNVERQKFLGDIFTEAKGLTKNFKNFHSLSRLKTRLVDNAVVETQKDMLTILNKAFEGINPTDKEMKAVFRAFLKTDVSSLNLSMTKLTELLENPNTLNRDIARIEASLKNDPNFSYYQLQTKALGYYMATGKVTSDNMNFNAKQISQMFGMGTTNPNAAKAEKSIDMLASLYALKYTAPQYKTELAEFIKRNEQEGPENGMTFLQKFHQMQKEDDLKDNFTGSEVNVTKGYTYEDTDPNVSVLLLTEEEGKMYESKGWVKIGLHRDPADPSTKMAMYVDTSGGDTRTINSIISFTSKQARGTDTVKRRQAMGDDSVLYSAGKDKATIEAAKLNSFKAQLAKAGSFDPTKASTGMAPKFDLKGKITGYRYIMQEDVRDKVLNRNTNALSVLAKGSAHSLNKVNTTEINKVTVKALKDHFDQKPNGNYISFGPDSNDPEVREMYARLPKEAKDDIRKTWGRKSMMVDREIYNMMFGYRKFSVADELAKEKSQQNIAIRFLGVIAGMLGKPFNRSAEQVARSTGLYWQEYVSIVKDFIVIKSGIVTLINTLSNSAQLYVEKIPLRKVISYQKEAVVELAKYREDTAELKELEVMVRLNINPSKHNQYNTRIAQLQSRITANPVTPVIEDGLLQDIVEDVSMLEDDFSKTSRLADKIDKKYLTKVPGFVRGAASEVLMTSESFLYKKLSQGAQLSDFMARYALYKHSIDNGMARDDAANKAIDTFVNYDLPTNRFIQYLNDMGLLWFTKYYIRIQKILLRSLIESPARVIGLLTLDFLTGDGIATVFDTYLSPTNLKNRMGLVEDPIDTLSSSMIGNLIL